MMPDMDGFQVCEALRQNERTREIPVILLTAKDDMETRVVGMRLGRQRVPDQADQQARAVRAAAGADAQPHLEHRMDATAATVADLAKK